ncbi:MAG: hypothetical protein WCT49_05160 [Candidatus Paceibacterota bacterium]|jgi:hypothetical protein|nr:hypothetical protein [Candidatus Paceibacterota bacterium]
MNEQFFPPVENERPENGLGAELNTLKSEHLNEGVRPIIAGVGTLSEFYQEEDSIVRKIFKGPENDTTLDDVNYFDSPENLTNRNYKNPSEDSYVISPVNDKDKISRSYRDCTGIAVSGVDKETGKNISFLSHQDPKYFLSEQNTDAFFKDLEGQIAELKKQCLPGTIDAVIFGGNYYVGRKGGKFSKNYIGSINILSTKISPLLGFTPAVITGPKTGDGGESIYFDNENRRLYIVRLRVGDSGTESYMPADIKDQEAKWKKDAEW